MHVYNVPSEYISVHTCWILSCAIQYPDIDAPAGEV